MLQEYTHFTHWADYYAWASRVTSKYGIPFPVDFDDNSTEETN